MGLVTTDYDLGDDEGTDEYGHQDGYNGIISTTSGYTELPEHMFKGMRAKTRVLILEALAGGYGLDKFPSTKAKEVFDALRSMGYRGTEKWGRCYAAKVKHNLYTFSGLAGC